MCPLSAFELILATVIMGAAACLQASIGFGLAMVAAPFLALFHPSFIPGPMILNGLVLNLLVVFRERRSVDLGGVRWALLGSALGTSLAALVLARISADGFTLLFGGLVLLGVLLSVAGVRLHLSRRALVSAGLLSGFMGTSSAIGGPPMALVYQNERGGRLRGTLAAYFTVTCCFSLAALASVGRFGIDEIHQAAFLLPGLLLGFALSSRTAHLLDRAGTRPLVLGLSVLAAVSLLARFGG